MHMWNCLTVQLSNCRTLHDQAWLILVQWYVTCACDEKILIFRTMEMERKYITARSWNGKCFDAWNKKNIRSITIDIYWRFAITKMPSGKIQGCWKGLVSTKATGETVRFATYQPRQCPSFTVKASWSPNLSRQGRAGDQPTDKEKYRTPFSITSQKHWKTQSDYVSYTHAQIVKPCQFQQLMQWNSLSRDHCAHGTRKKQWLESGWGTG